MEYIMFLVLQEHDTVDVVFVANEKYKYGTENSFYCFTSARIQHSYYSAHERNMCRNICHFDVFKCRSAESSLTVLCVIIYSIIRHLVACM